MPSYTVSTRDLFSHFKDFLVGKISQSAHPFLPEPLPHSDTGSGPVEYLTEWEDVVIVYYHWDAPLGWEGEMGERRGGMGEEERERREREREEGERWDGVYKKKEQLWVTVGFYDSRSSLRL